MIFEGSWDLELGGVEVWSLGLLGLSVRGLRVLSARVGPYGLRPQDGWLYSGLGGCKVVFHAPRHSGAACKVCRDLRLGFRIRWLWD